MCGLFGMLPKTKSLKFTDFEIWRFFDMAVINSVRGADSSSIWGIPTQESKFKSVQVWKALGDPFNLINGKYTGEIWKFMKNDAACIFGHGRKATVGKITLANAHPFKHNNIILSHNGTLTGGLDGKEKELEVDSHALTILVQEKGIMSALQQIEGAFAIIAYDTEKNRILIARNHQRPLHFCETHDMIFVMSDKKALDYVLDRSNKYNAVIKEFQAEKVYEIDPEAPTLETITPIKSKWETTSYYGALYNNKKNEEKPFSFPHNVKPFTYDKSTWKIQPGEEVIFFVEDISKPGNNPGSSYKYHCIDDDNNELVFWSPDHHPEWNMMQGKAKVMNGQLTTLPDGKTKLVYVLREKDIEWIYQMQDLSIEDQTLIREAGTCIFCKNPIGDTPNEMLEVVDHVALSVAHTLCLETVEKVLNEDEPINHIPV